MLILISKENVGKSKFFKTLCPNPAWFTDYLPRDLHSQQASESVMGKFIIESAELASFGKSAIEAIKAFISREVENFRPAYGHFKIAYRRRCVLVGSTNNAAALQRGEEWTRAWPVHVREYNHAYLLATRDQVWAEAVALYRGGFEWWNLPDRLEAELAQARADCTESDSWEDVLSRINGNPTDSGGFQTSIAECQAVLEIPVERRNRANEIRIGIIMNELGWSRRRMRMEGKLVWRLVRSG
jgi:putative DNA primase/helicase